MDIVNIFSVVITTISLILAILFYWKSRRIKKPYYHISSINLLNPEIKKQQDIKVSYKDNKVDDLTVTNFMLGNAGNETIDKIDVPESAPLTIRAKNIYSYDIIESFDLSNKVRADLIKNSEPEQVDELVVTFDYLDKGQRAVINIVHSGNLTVSGKIKGVGEYKRSFHVKSKFNLAQVILYVLIGLLVILIVYLPNSSISVKNYSIFSYFFQIAIAILLLFTLVSIRNKQDEE